MSNANVVYDDNGHTTVVQRDAQLLACAQAIYGDIVTDAWVSTFHGKLQNVAEAAERIKHDAARLHVPGELDLEKGSLSYDGCEIVLQFSNGRQVKFGNSEWAHMARVDVSTMLVLS